MVKIKSGNNSEVKNKSKFNIKSKNEKKAKNVRYFESEIIDESEIKKIDLNKIKNQKFEGEVIKVNLKERPSKYEERKKANYLKYKAKKAKLPKKRQGVRTSFFKEKLQRKEIRVEYANEQVELTEIYKAEEDGCIIPDPFERTVDFTQEQIIKNVDITAATKHFNLNLEFGPYNFRYTRNGRHLLLGGRRGHVAAFDWITKKIHCEMNVMEELADISWLHLETMFACAQKNHVFFYDNQGTEIHCVKRLHKINRLEFLPYHFLLSTGSAEGYLSWLDISIGEIVEQYNTKLGDIRIMKQNPVNGVICIGSGTGVVSMWSPTVRQPLAKLLCHGTPLSAIAVDNKGINLATTGLDKKLKIWDVRALSGPKAIYKLPVAARSLDFSQKSLLSISMGNVCEIYNKSILENDKTTPYLRHRTEKYINDIHFCPYEDVLGISTETGFTSILAPGSCEPNFDALEANPFQTKSQRRENEVKALLDKVPANLISLNPTEILSVDVDTLESKIEAKKSLLFVETPVIDYKPRKKMKGKGGSAKMAKNKKIVKEVARKEFTKHQKKVNNDIYQKYKQKDEQDFIPLEGSSSVLDRFKSKKQKK